MKQRRIICPCLNSVGLTRKSKMGQQQTANSLTLSWFIASSTQSAGRRLASSHRTRLSRRKIAAMLKTVSRSLKSNSSQRMGSLSHLQGKCWNLEARLQWANASHRSLSCDTSKKFTFKEITWCLHKRKYSKKFQLSLRVLQRRLITKSTLSWKASLMMSLKIFPSTIHSMRWILKLTSSSWVNFNIQIAQMNYSSGIN